MTTNQTANRMNADGMNADGTDWARVKRAHPELYHKEEVADENVFLKTPGYAWVVTFQVEKVRRGVPCTGEVYESLKVTKDGDNWKITGRRM